MKKVFLTLSIVSAMYFANATVIKVPTTAADSTAVKTTKTVIKPAAATTTTSVVKIPKPAVVASDSTTTAVTGVNTRKRKQ